MYLGTIVEMASKEDLYKNPLHPYTKALLAAIPKPDPNQKSDISFIKGEIPSNVNLPKGCPYHTRCPLCKGYMQRESARK